MKNLPSFFFGEEAKPYTQKKSNVEDQFNSELLTQHGSAW